MHLKLHVHYSGTQKPKFKKKNFKKFDARWQGSWARYAWKAISLQQWSCTLSKSAELPLSMDHGHWKRTLVQLRQRLECIVFFFVQARSIRYATCCMQCFAFIILFAEKKQYQHSFLISGSCALVARIWNAPSLMSM